MTRVLLLGLLGACYSPSYRDCEVACAGGACPSGLSCDPALKVCRLEGAGGACGQGSGSADAATADVPGDRFTGTFCDTQPGITFCQDFDTTPLDMQGWTAISETNGGTAGLVSSTRSPPSAFEATTPASDGSTEASAQVQKILTIEATFTSIVFAFDVMFVQRDGALLPKAAAHLGHGAYSIDMASNGATQTYFIISGQTATQTFDDGLTLGTWYRYEITLIQSNQQISATVKRDGVAIGNAGGQVGGPQPFPVGATTWDMSIGAFNVSQNGACRFDFDNVVVNATL